MGGISYWTDSGLLRDGIVVAFSERAGGVSEPPYDSLNLAAHVGDTAAHVDENRRRFLSATGLSGYSASLVTAEQVHGLDIAHITRADAGRGAHAGSTVRAPIPGTDALITSEPGIPMMLCFADCVPVVIVAPQKVVGVVHAGWRGALGSLPGLVADAVASEAGCATSEVLAYVGPHIRACHYEVGDDVMSRFVGEFGGIVRDDSGGLDLEAAVRESLTRTGVDHSNVVSIGACTAETTGSFYSFRAEAGATGRHGALACLLP